MRTELLAIYLLSFFSSAASLNSFSQAGYINLPSAENLKEASVAYTFSRNEPDRKFMITASPFDWMDATIFYADITGEPYGSGFKQSLKDKGFNIKFSKKTDLPFADYIALGLNDFAGTGIYSGEYVVSTKWIDDYEITIGMGWGSLNNSNSFQNPLGKINNKFYSRPTKMTGNGGRLDFNKYFSGKHASVFFAGSKIIAKNSKIIFEYDTTERDGRIKYPEYRNNINIGFEKQINNFLFKTSLIGGSEINFNFSFVQTYPTKYKDINHQTNKVENLNDLRSFLELNKIALTSVYEDKKTVHLNIRHNSFQNQVQPNSIVKMNTKNVFPDKSRIAINHEAIGMEVLKVYYPNETTNIKNETYIDEENETEVIYLSELKYPIISSNFFPNIKSMIGSREGFLYQGFSLENNTEIVLRKNMFILSNIKFPIANNFNELYIPPVNTYPNQVRSDIKEYLRNYDSPALLGRLELNYFKSFERKNFFRFSAGIFEDMFSGIGVDYQYYPEGSLFSLGFESYYVKKRDYKMIFDHQDYSNYLSRMNLQIVEPRSNINLRLSYGEYLAGDTGFTFELSRRFSNGIEFSGYFTRTNVSSKQYGEGSFDKGVKIIAPLPSIKSLFKENSGLNVFSWRPLTKDPGALLVKSVDLRGYISRFRYYDWNSMNLI